MKLVMCMVDFLIPVLMLAFGLVFWRCPSREVDKWYGYRTRRALKSPEAYVYAPVSYTHLFAEGRCAVYYIFPELGKNSSDFTDRHLFCMYDGRICLC